MNDRFLVRGFEPLGNLFRHTERFRNRNRPLRNPLGQRRTLDQFHYKIIRPDVVERADVGMVQGSDRLRFALEAIGKLPGGNLDRDIAIQPWIARFPYLAHAALADGTDEFVRTEFCAGSRSMGNAGSL